jgi:GNAT superfamily N-acetyltransferase
MPDDKFNEYLPALATLAHAVFVQTPKAGSLAESEAILKLMAGKGGEFLLSDADGTLTGFAAEMRFTDTMLGEPRFVPFRTLGAAAEDYYFAFIAVHPEHRGSGTAVALLDVNLEVPSFASLRKLSLHPVPPSAEEKPSAR